MKTPTHIYGFMAILVICMTVIACDDEPANPITTETFVEKVKEERVKMEAEHLIMYDSVDPGRTFTLPDLDKLPPEVTHLVPALPWLVIKPEEGGKWKPETVTVESRTEPIVTKAGDKWVIKFKKD